MPVDMTGGSFEQGAPSGGEKLQKLLARCGMGSRRACELMIASGQVTVNGVKAHVGQRVDPVADTIAIDGVPAPLVPGAVYYLLNKPAGVVTSATAQDDRKVVLDFVPREPRVFTVGRLDADSEGLLVLTNDGELAHRLAHPSHGVEKEYLVDVGRSPSAQALKALRDGIPLDDGPSAPARVGVVAPGTVRIVIHEGRNRLVRRMFAAVGLPVNRLVRTRIGPIRDPDLAPGRWRPLTSGEVRSLAVAAWSAGSRPAATSGCAGGRG